MLMKTTVAPTPSLAGKSGITLDALRVSYHGNVVLKPLTLTIEPGEVLALIGPSGSGKTTVLRAIAGFVQPAGGRILLGDTDITHLPPYQRGLGMVVQNYALFPHMKVEDNVAFGLRAQKQPKAQIAERIQDALKIVGMADYASRYPHQLSGGQQQRVGVARALAANPEVLLMDEPFGALDPVTREALQQEMIRIHRLLGRTIVLVTHDIDEALRLADHLVLMDGGGVVQQGEPLQMLLEPKNAFVETFFGRSELGVRLLSLRGVSDYLRRDERLAGDALNVTMTLREALSQFVAHRREVLPVVDEQGEACGTLHFADLLREEARREGAA